MHQLDYNILARSLFVPSQTQILKFQKLTVERYHMNVSIINGAATTKVEIVFHNPNKSEVGGSFVFLVPPVMDPSFIGSIDTDISKIELWIDGNLTKPSLLEYNKLETFYQQILETQDLQSLQRMLSDSGLSVEIPQIPAHSECQIQIRYPDLVEWIDECFLYMEPLKINQPVRSFAISMELEDEGRIGEVQSNFADEDIDRESDTRVRMTYQATNINNLDARIDCFYTLGDGVFLDETDISF